MTAWPARCVRWRRVLPAGLAGLSCVACCALPVLIAAGLLAGGARSARFWGGCRVVRSRLWWWPWSCSSCRPAGITFAAVRPAGVVTAPPSQEVRPVDDRRSRRDRCPLGSAVRPGRGRRDRWGMAGLAGRARAPRLDLDRRRGGLGLYGFVATLQPDANFGRILAAYGGVFVAGSLLWGVALDGFRPDRWDITGALICLVGVAVSCTPRARPEEGAGERAEQVDRPPARRRGDERRSSRRSGRDLFAQDGYRR